MHILGRPIAVFVILCGLLSPQHDAMAHPGELDSSGCHRTGSTDAGHCHSDREEGEWKMGTVFLVTGFLIVWLAAEWYDHNLSMAGPLQVSPYFGKEREAGVVAEYSLGDAQKLGLRTVTHAEERGDEVHFGIYWRLEF